ncbi:superinfection immunity protein [Streptomyces sp. NBC_01358]|uniref:superinfection immunity protein n=1 Tax=Streptomyces sp. NBC_01358 TaxID=2903837 RepID=UPI002E335813|nr:superinfection immunity protein [Streptomyces sp. NBC_01358]
MSASTDRGVGDRVEYVVTGLIALAGMAVHLVPSLTAFNRGADNRWLVLVVNVVLGATFLGRGVALVPALRGPRAPSVM